MESLKELKCIPCRGGEPALTELEIKLYKPQVPDWQVIVVEGVSRLRRVYRFKNFLQALDFTNQVGKLAEAEDHHPALLTEWGRVTVDWWTHKINGLHRNDFIMAAKSDSLYQP